MAYLANPVSRRVRTNHQVERTNRMFRPLEEVRYKWRRPRALVRFVVLTPDGIWEGSTPMSSAATAGSSATGPAKTGDETRK
jgi:hypothetical protein